MDSHRSITKDYHPKPGIYKARDLVEITAPLLSAIISKLGGGHDVQSDTKNILVGGLVACLMTSGRESTLPLSYFKNDSSRTEIANQASKIGSTLVSYSYDTVSLESLDPYFDLYSQCEGHLWTSEVASLLLGPRSNPNLMQLYNEWLHRMILLRDALLPFENFEDIPLVIPANSFQGLRAFEQPRKEFLVQCLTGRISQSTIVDVSKVFTARSLTPGGYGLQYSQGLILPAFLSSSSSLHLLRYHPARIDASKTDILFEYEQPVYFDCNRTGLPEAVESLPPGHWPPSSLLAVNPSIAKSSIGMSPGPKSYSRILKLEMLLDDGAVVSVDVGQIARGHRYAYRCRGLGRQQGEDVSVRLRPLYIEARGDSANRKQEATSSAEPMSLPREVEARIYLHDTARILRLPGLITSGQWDDPDQLHIFPAIDPLVGLALLGKLYPENVVLLHEHDCPTDAFETGKGFGARLVVIQQSADTAKSSDSGYESPK